MRAAIARIEALETVVEKPALIRIETLSGAPHARRRTLSPHRGERAG